MVYQLLYADAVRGWDATGVVTVHSNGDFGIMKEASEATYFNAQFIDSDLDKDLYRNGRAVIGHNRAKTVGANKDENAHPFVVDQTFAMVHNGTLTNHHELTKTDVDSEALAIEFKKAMDAENFKEELQLVLGRVRGAFACVWYDQKRHQICMIRNSQRPLGLAIMEDEIIFASELGLAGWIASRNNQKVKEYKSLDVHTLYTFDMSEEGLGVYNELFLHLKYPWPQKPTGFTNGVTPGSSGTLTVIPPGTNSTGPKATPLSNSPSKEEEEDGPRGQGTISKNQAKRLKSQLFLREIEFQVDDYVPTYGTTFMVMGASVNGAYDLCEIRHNIQGLTDIAEMYLKEEDFYAEGLTMTGIVRDVTYDKDVKGVSIKVEFLKLVGFKAKEVIL